MKKAIIYLLTLCILMTGVLATATFINPGASDILKGSEVINVSTGVTNAINCSVTATSASTGSSIAIVLYNRSAGSQCANATLDTTGEIDAADWSWGGTCQNATVSESITTRGSIIIDNTKPVCSQSSLVSGTTYDPSGSTVTVTATNATACTMLFGTNPYTMTESSDVCTYDITDVPEGTYDVQITSTDGTNTTSCTQVTSVTLDVANKRGKKIKIVTYAEEQSKGMSTGTVFLLLALVGGLFYFGSKKK